MTARLIVRRVRRLAPAGQTELGPAWRYHAVFTNSPFGTLVAESDHRNHAIIELDRGLEGLREDGDPIPL